MATTYESGADALHEEAFCEYCYVWADDIKYDVRLSIPDNDSLVRVKDGDLEHLFTFAMTKDKKSRHIRLNIHHCPKCSDTITLDVDLCYTRKESDGTLQAYYEDYSAMYIIDEDLFTQFKRKNFVLPPK